MILDIGARLGPYEIAGLLGVGGMGEVYRARDTRLERDVAIKVIPPPLADDPQRLARFEREARMLASLNHPHIAQLYGVEEAAGHRALVMELVHGVDLAERIGRGPIAISEALSIARQIAEALEAAHEQGIVHRDLKPANIKVRPDGTVKVLDFGLAKLSLPAVSDTASTMATPAASVRGMLIGTAGYMSPEQARGDVVDKRTDIWAFGVILFEMLSGKWLFDGRTISDSIAAVLTVRPDFAGIPAETPNSVRLLLARCLDHDVRQRLRDIGEARVALEAASGAPIPSAAAGLPVVSTRARWRSRVWRIVSWAVAAVAVLALGVVLTRSRPFPQAAETRRLDVRFGPHAAALTVAGRGLGPSTVLSPDGTMVAFIGRDETSQAPRVYVRTLDALESRPLAGTEGAALPFFSPDGRWLAFFAAGKLKKIALAGGAPLTIADASDTRGGAWGEDGFVYFTPTPRGELMRVSAEGGIVQPATTLDVTSQEITHRFPQVLPRGKALLYTAHTRTVDYDQASIVVQMLPGGARKIVHRGGYHGRYVPSGHLVYVHGGTLFAEPFDLERLEARGPAVPVVASVETSTVNAGAEFATSANGLLLYRPGGGAEQRNLVIMDGSDVRTLRQLRGARGPLRFSPDGLRLTFVLGDSGGPGDVWIYEWQRDVLTRFTTNADTDIYPCWTSDGQHIAYSTWQPDVSSPNVMVARVDGAGQPQRLTKSSHNTVPNDWHPTDRFVVYNELTPDTGWDLMILPVERGDGDGWKPGTPRPLVASAANEIDATFSPNGEWVAYTSDESGAPEIYVRAFARSGARQQVSTGGGRFAQWVRGRSGLVYRGPDGSAMLVAFQVRDGAFVSDRPRRWMTLPRNESSESETALHPDGRRLAAFAPLVGGADGHSDRLILVTGFFQELQRLAPRIGQ